MAVSKKRVIKSLETLSDDVRELVKDQYPGGYESSITRIMNAKKEPIFVFPLETEDAIYLVKVPATKNSDGGYDVDSGAPQEFDKPDDEGLAAGDDDFAPAKGDDDDDFDDDAAGKGVADPSYDPDFDN